MRSHFTECERLYFEDLPPKPYCKLTSGRLLIRPKRQAIEFPLVQPNYPHSVRWLLFDIDAPDAQFRAEDRGCPEPTFIAINPQNGHAHMAYRLDTPVLRGSKASQKAETFLEDVTRGLTNKLGADPCYNRLLAKNPLWRGWAVQWLAVRPYQLETLNDYLAPNDKRRKKEPNELDGRNVFLFNSTRSEAVQVCLSMKRQGRSESEFQKVVHDICAGINSALPKPLTGGGEVRGIAKSVSKWTWRHTTLEGFSAIQSYRANVRWANTDRPSAGKPWILLGISRRTWERRRRTGLIS